MQEPEVGRAYVYFGGTPYPSMPGTGATVHNLLDTLQKAVNDAKWPCSHGIDYAIGGKGRMKRLDEMAEPRPTLMEVLPRSPGSSRRHRP